MRAPTAAGLPALQTLLDDIPTTRRELARFLDVTAATLARWERAGAAPRPVMLALFWESRFGASVAHCAADNAARWHAGAAKAWERRARRLDGVVAGLLAERAELLRGATRWPANDPFAA